ncbi:MAG: hypothetical protein DRQ48_01505 [Gammaproteobacteria bacterium]|nr:MAG: hypothetical protein DRQ58_03775 [Gammaproteobacteria bacterium]RKZ72074.1 MAG: hypothetical protein DRQ48_01505 [Gammaproteobacteria bacterium]
MLALYFRNILESTTHYYVVLLLAIFTTLSGCSTYRPVHDDETHYLDRVTRFESDNIIIEAAALGRNESKEVFGAPLNDVGVQAVWIKISNNSEEANWLFPISVDSEYFPAFEVARRISKYGKISHKDLYAQLVENQIPNFIPPQHTVSGFVYTHADEGLKSFIVELHSPSRIIKHTIVAPVPGLPDDYFDLDPENIYSEAEFVELDKAGLRNWLEKMACCAQSINGQYGDPINIVFVGHLNKVRSALISRQWDVTAPVTGSSLRRMISAFIFGSRYRYAPISPLYMFNREHDLAFQKSRAIIDERNHMRLWLAPVTFNGEHVWVAQISRDDGIKLSGRLRPPTTHVIDPDMDDARFYLLQDILQGQEVRQIGFVKGHKPATYDNPHYNAENDFYFTDGLRAVFFMSDEPTKISAVKLLDWELPKGMEAYREIIVSE